MTLANTSETTFEISAFPQQAISTTQGWAVAAWKAAQPGLIRRAQAVLHLGLGTPPETLLLIGAVALLAMGAIHLIVLLAGLLLFLLKGTAVVVAGLAVYQWLVAAGTRIDAVLTKDSVDQPQPAKEIASVTAKKTAAKKATVRKTTAKQTPTRRREGTTKSIAKRSVSSKASKA